MTHEQLIEQEAEKRYVYFGEDYNNVPEGYTPNDISTISRESFISGGNFALSMDRWVKVEEGLPPVKEKFSESDYVLCTDEYDTMFTAWYNNRTARWYYAHHDHSGIPKPTHWMPLPEPPEK
jgi:hypothetical protein